MDFETWWLIFIPLLFGLGWVAARTDIRQILSETRSLPDSYFKGLNFILNEQPDRAIDAFVEVAKLDPETTELHFALGSLFRRRGEMERAIRVHQSLLARDDLPQSQREQALHALAQDFLKAGMLDRAEQAFEQVANTRFAVSAVRALIRIYESEHDWPRAIETVQRLKALVDEPVPLLVHYQCEQAQAALARKPADTAAARQALDLAEAALEQNLKQQPQPAAQARIAILSAQLAHQTDDVEGERLWLQTVLEQTPDYAGLVARPLFDNYQRSGQAAAGLERLRQHYTQHPGLDVFNVVLRGLREQDAQAAWAFAREALQAQPFLLGLDRVLESELALAADKANTNEHAITPIVDMALLRQLIHRHTQRLDRYACRQCGFEARHFYWQCPGCNGWETYQPRRMEETA